MTLEKIKTNIGADLKNKRLLIIILLVPLSFTILFGLIYSQKTIGNLDLAVVNHSESQLSRNLIASFDKTDTFKVSKYFAFEEEAFVSLEKGEIQGFIVIPQGFTEDVKSGKQATLLLAADGSNMSISNTVLTKGSEIAGTISAGIAVKKYEAAGTISQEALEKSVPISFKNRNWFNPANNYSNFLLIGYVAAIVQQVVIYFAAITITEERKWLSLGDKIKSREGLWHFLVSKLGFFTGMGMLSWLTSSLVVFYIFKTPMRGAWASYLLLSLVFFFAISSVGLLISTMSRRSLDATQYGLIVALPSFLICGYTWPFIAMSWPLKAIGHLFPISYFVTNIRDIALMAAGLGNFYGHMLVLLLLGLTCFLLSYKRLKIEYLDNFAP